MGATAQGNPGSSGPLPPSAVGEGSGAGGWHGAGGSCTPSPTAQPGLCTVGARQDPRRSPDTTNIRKAVPPPSSPSLPDWKEIWHLQLPTPISCPTFPCAVQSLTGKAFQGGGLAKIIIIILTVLGRARRIAALFNKTTKKRGLMFVSDILRTVIAQPVVRLNPHCTDSCGGIAGGSTAMSLPGWPCRALGGQRVQPRGCQLRPPVPGHSQGQARVQSLVPCRGAAGARSRMAPPWDTLSMVEGHSTSQIGAGRTCLAMPAQHGRMTRPPHRSGSQCAGRARGPALPLACPTRSWDMRATGDSRTGAQPDLLLHLPWYITSRSGWSLHLAVSRSHSSR